MWLWTVSDRKGPVSPSNFFTLSIVTNRRTHMACPLARCLCAQGALRTSWFMLVPWRVPWCQQEVLLMEAAFGLWMVVNIWAVTGWEWSRGVLRLWGYYYVWYRNGESITLTRGVLQSWGRNGAVKGNVVGMMLPVHPGGEPASLGDSLFSTYKPATFTCVVATCQLGIIHCEAYRSNFILGKIITRDFVWLRWN